MFNMISHQGNVNENNSEKPHTPVKLLKWKRLIILNVGEDVVWNCHTLLLGI